MRDTVSWLTYLCTVQTYAVCHVRDTVLYITNWFPDEKFVRFGPYRMIVPDE